MYELNAVSAHQHENDYFFTFCALFLSPHGANDLEIWERKDQKKA